MAERAGPPRRRRRVLPGLLLEIGIPLTVLAALNVYAIHFVAAEQTLYRADQLAYWSYAGHLADDLQAQPLEAIFAVAWSVAHQELNLLPALPVALVLMAVGTSRTAYVLTVLDLYGLAVVLVLVAALRAVDPDGRRPPPLIIAIAATAALLLFPSLWRPVFTGYLGLGGVALAMVVLALYCHGRFRDNSVAMLCLVGVLITLLALFRRWYGVWSLAMCCVVAVESLAVALRSARHPGGIWRSLRVPIIVVGVAAVVLFLLAAPLTLARFEPSYTEEFAAFEHHGDLLARLDAVIGQFGLLPLAVVAASVVVLVWERPTRRIGVLLPVHSVLTFAVMTSLQDHSQHHWYLYLATGLLLVGLGLARILALARPLPGAWVALTVLGVGLTASAAVFAGPAERFAGRLGHLVPRARVRPIVRDDIAEVRRLLEYLDQRLAESDGEIYVLAASQVLSDHTLAFANLSLESDYAAPSRVLQGAHVDRRDGFPRGLLQADYVLVAQPVQINMRPEDQQVIVIPAESFLSGKDIARAFRRLPEEFVLEDDVRVWVYSRRRAIVPDEVVEFSERLREVHPDRPDIWRP